MKPRVSVVISVFNGADNVRGAVEGILGQTYRQLELIVVDDGSTDATGDVLMNLKALDDRIHVLRHDNQGLTKSLIAACQRAQGEFIARQDADDWSHPDRIKEQVALLDSDARIGFVSCATEYVGPEGEHLDVVVRPADAELATKELLEKKQGPPAHGSVIFRASLYYAVGGYRRDFYYGQDSDLWLRMAEHAWVAYLPNVRYRHRKDPSSISGASRDLQKSFGRLAHACKAARQVEASEGRWLEQARLLSNSIVSSRERSLDMGSSNPDISYMIGSQLARNRDARASRYLRDVLRSKPWHLRAWVRLIQSKLLASNR